MISFFQVIPTAARSVGPFRAVSDVALFPPFNPFLSASRCEGLVVASLVLVVYISLFSQSQFLR